MFSPALLAVIQASDFHDRLDFLLRKIHNFQNFHENSACMIRLDFRHLEMIDAIVRAGSVSAAAERMGVSQSALSHRIREAERRLNTQLFFRENRRLVLTSAGKRIRQAAETVLKEMGRAEREVERLSGRVRHVVRLGAVSYTPLHWLPVLYDRLDTAAPDINLEVVADPTLDPEEALRDNLYDIAVASGPVSARTVDSRLLRRDEMVALLAHDHPLAGRAVLYPDDFSSSTYIACHTLPERGREYELLFRRHDILPARVIQAGIVEALVELVRHGKGLTIMPRWAAEAHMRLSGLVSIPLGPDPITIDWNVMTRGRDATDNPTRRVAGLIEELIRSE